MEVDISQIDRNGIIIASIVMTALAWFTMIVAELRFRKKQKDYDEK